MVVNINDLTAAMDRACADMLGETIGFKASGAASYSDLQAHVDYRDAVQSLEVSKVVAQDIAVSVLKADLAAKPGSGDRVTLPLLPGKVFKPANVRSDSSGREWNFELQSVPNG